MLELGADQQKIFALLDKIRILRIIYSLSFFFLGSIKTPWGDAPKFVTAFSVGPIYRR